MNAPKDAPRPNLVLLDLNLPRMNGHEALVDMKNDPDLRPIPVVVLSGSDAERYVPEAYALTRSSPGAYTSTHGP